MKYFGYGFILFHRWAIKLLPHAELAVAAYGCNHLRLASKAHSAEMHSETVDLSPLRDWLVVTLTENISVASSVH